MSARGFAAAKTAVVLGAAAACVYACFRKDGAGVVASMVMIWLALDLKRSRR